MRYSQNTILFPHIFTTASLTGIRLNNRYLKMASVLGLALSVSGCTLDILGGHRGHKLSEVFSWSKSSAAAPPLLPTTPLPDRHTLSTPDIPNTNSLAILAAKTNQAQYRASRLKRKIGSQNKEFRAATQEYERARRNYRQAKQQYRNVSRNMGKHRRHLAAAKARYQKAESHITRTRAQLHDANRQYQKNLRQKQRAEKEYLQAQKMQEKQRQRAAREKQNRQRLTHLREKRTKWYDKPPGSGQQINPSNPATLYRRPRTVTSPPFSPQKTGSIGILPSSRPVESPEPGRHSTTPPDSSLLTAIHRSLPIGSYAEVINRENNRRVAVRIVQKGINNKYRIMDVSPQAGCLLGINRHGSSIVSVNRLNMQEGQRRILQDEANYIAMIRSTKSACRNIDF